MGTKNGGKTRFRVKKQRRVNGYHIKDIPLDLYKRTTDIVVGHNAFALQRPQKLVVGTVYCILYCENVSFVGVREDSPRRNRDDHARDDPIVIKSVMIPF